LGALFEGGDDRPHYSQCRTEFGLESAFVALRNPLFKTSLNATLALVFKTLDMKRKSLTIQKRLCFKRDRHV
jgi:hypothetical protein